MAGSARRFDGKVGGWFVVMLVAINALLIGIIPLAFWIGADHPELVHGVDPGASGVVALAVSLAALVPVNILMVPMAMRSRNYIEVDDEQVRVVCGLFSKRVPLDQVESVHTGSMWMPNVGPTLSIQGRSQGTGDQDRQGRRLRSTWGLGTAGQGVYIEGAASRVYCSPENPSALVSELKKRVSKLSGA